MERVWYEGKRKPQKQADDKPKKTITKKKQKKKSAEVKMNFLVKTTIGQVNLNINYRL